MLAAYQRLIKGSTKIPQSLPHMLPNSGNLQYNPKTAH